MLSLDLGLFNRKAHAIRYREAAIWSAIWVTLAMIFGGIVFWFQGTDLGLKFLTGYVIELLLLSGPGKGAAPGAFLGRYGCPFYALDDDFRRRRSDQSVSLDPLYLRCVPGVHGNQNVSAGGH